MLKHSRVSSSSDISGGGSPELEGLGWGFRAIDVLRLQRAPQRLQLGLLELSAGRLSVN